jgi:hypothetical protein
MKALYGTAAGAAMASVFVFLGVLSTTTPVSAADVKITICHATGNDGHFNDITVSLTAAGGVPTGSEILGALAQSGHFDSSGNPVHFRESWGGHDFWLNGDVSSDDCNKVWEGGGGK